MDVGETEKRTNLARNTVLSQEISSARSGEDIVSSRVQLLNGRKQLQLLLVTTNREQNVLVGRGNTSRDQCLYIRFVLVLSETGDFTS